MIERRLEWQLDRVARRLRRLRLMKRLAFCWLAAAAAGLVLLAVAWTGETPAGLSAGTWILPAGAVAVAATLVIVSLVAPLNRSATARRIEEAFPPLDQSLLTAIEQEPEVETGRYGYLQATVIEHVLAHGRQYDWNQTIPSRRLAGAYGLQAFCFVLFAGVIATLSATRQVPLDPPAMVQARETSRQTTSAGSPEIAITVEPGDASVERGSPLPVLARFSGGVPGKATLVWSENEGESRQTALTKGLDDPVFGGRIPSVERDTGYRIIYDGRKTRRYKVTVFDYPALERADATVVFPDYTGLPETTVEDARQVRVVEGATVVLTCRVNKPLAARLVRAGGRGQVSGDRSQKSVSPDDQTAGRPGLQTVPLEAASGEKRVYRVSLKPKETQRYRLELTDAAGRSNKQPPEFVIEVAPNRRPELKLAFPAKDVPVSPLEELSLEAAASDDFGIEKYGLIYAFAGEEPQTVVLGNEVPGKTERPIAHQVSFERLDAEPDQLLSYYFFADDVGPNGESRRTYSDMYFAEVRPFEEIFRQGQQPPGGASMQGGGQNAQKVDQLARLQKQIMNATWKIVRRETDAAPSEHFVKDVEAVAGSQRAAVEKLQKLASKLRTPKSQALARGVREHMQRAVEALAETADADKEDAGSLRDALAPEQAAYQALLKLRAREHRVTKGQGGGGGGGGGSRSQQQLNQLELTNKKDRYESERQASSGKRGKLDREQLQVLNRLRELARRQGTLNEKLKELKNRLRAAQTEREREEIRRRLKRLREQQREIVRDLDRLKNRMDRPENQTRMTKARQQVEQTRSRARRSSEALRKGQVSQALNEGTRAERRLSQLRDEFRRKTAGEFAETMRNLRQQAREMAERQQELKDRLAEADDKRRPGLRDSRARREMEDGFREQQRRFERVVDRMQHVVRQAEHSEPVLSDRLYETIRQARADQPAENLEAASQHMRRGDLPEAREAEEQAREGIETVKRGVEQAAEGILGSEVEALKLAQNELEDLSEQLDREIEQKAGQSGRSRSSQSGSDNEHRSQQDGQPGGRQKSDAKGEKPRQGGRPTQRQQRKTRSSQSPGQQSQGGQKSSGNQNQPPQSGNSQKSSKQSPSQQNGSSKQSGSQQQSGGSSKSGSNSQSDSPSQSGASSQSGGSPGKGGLRGGQPNSGGKPSQGQPSFVKQGGFSRGPGGGPGGPLTGGNFQEFSDRLREVEEMLSDDELRSQVARVRDRARSMRVEFKRHSKEPEWDLVRESIFEPLVEVRRRVAEEIARKQSQDAVVPLDRDPVPEEFAEQVRRYYERLGSGK